METKKTLTLTPKFDYVTVLIILFFVLITIGVFLYFKHRLKLIDKELKRSSSHSMNYIEKSISHKQVFEI